MTNKLDETLGERNRSRERLIELRRMQLDAKAEVTRAEVLVAELTTKIQLEQRRLIELTTETGKLLHADLAGLIQKPGQSAPPEAPTVPA